MSSGMLLWSTTEVAATGYRHSTVTDFAKLRG